MHFMDGSDDIRPSTTSIALLWAKGYKILQVMVGLQLSGSAPNALCITE